MPFSPSALNTNYGPRCSVRCRQRGCVGLLNMLNLPFEHPLEGINSLQGIYLIFIALSQYSDSL